MIRDKGNDIQGLLLPVDLEEDKFWGREIMWHAMLRTMKNRHAVEPPKGFRQQNNRTKYRFCKTALEVLRMIMDLGGR